MQRSMAWNLGDGCGWEHMVASLVLLVSRGLGTGRGSRVRRRWLGRGLGVVGWDVGCYEFGIGKVDCLEYVG